MKSRYVFVLTVSVFAVAGMDSAWAIDTSKPAAGVPDTQTQRATPLGSSSVTRPDAGRARAVTSKTKPETPENLRIQQSMDKNSKLKETLSNVIKSESGTADAVTKNMK